MEEFLLAVLTFPQELNIVDYQRIDGAKLTLKAGQISFFDSPYKPVDEIFTAQELDNRVIEPSLRLETDGMQKMRLAQSGTSVYKKWIVSVSRGLTYRNTTGVSKTVARANHKILKIIIRMKSETGLAATISTADFFAGVNSEIQRDKMAGYLLGCMGETVFAIILQKLNGRLIGAAYSERAAIEMQDC